MSDRLTVNKTYKLYIKGQFPRTESGRYTKVLDKNDHFVGNACLSSRKDLRDAVTAAREAFSGWSSKSAFNRSQILYRIAEMLESRKEQFIEELMLTGQSKKDAQKEVIASIERLIHYAGWADKYSAVFSSVNPVASSHFDFSIPVAQGVVGIICPKEYPLIGFVTLTSIAICGGNTVVAIASEKNPFVASSFGEVLNSSDVPAGVINILTGDYTELMPHMAGHMDINTLIYAHEDTSLAKEAQILGAENLKRVRFYEDIDWLDDEDAESPYLIMDTQEVQTTWHPIGV